MSRGLTPDEDGKVAIYDLHAKEMIRRYPVDAREMLKVGSAALTPPGEGEKKAPKKAAKDSNPAASGDGSGPSEQEKADAGNPFLEYSKKELQEFAVANNLDHRGNKPEIADRLVEAGVNPEQPVAES